MAIQCTIHVTARGNRFMSDLANLYAAGLTDRGLATRVAFDEVPAGVNGTIDVVLAPHEFFTVGPGFAPEDEREILARCVVLTTEQPGAPWFDIGLPYARAALATLDLAEAGVRALSEHGVPATVAPIGYHKVLDAFGGDWSRPRTIDATFLGGATPRRLTALAGLAVVLHHRSSRLLLHDAGAPVIEESPWFVSGQRRAALLSNSKVLVNIHRSDEPYFEWFRAIDALSNGVALVTECSVGHEPLQPFVHFVSAEVSLLAAHVTALLTDESIRTDLARSGYDFVRSECRLVDRLDEVEALLRSVASHHTTYFADALPEPLPFAPGSHPPRPVNSQPAEQQGLGAGVKRVILDLIALNRRLDRLEAERRLGSPDVVVEHATPGWHLARPEVSVVVPAYRCAQTVLDAIRSAVESEDIAVEVIVVEDNSDDATPETLAAFLDGEPEAPVLTLFRAANGGLGAARNLGISRARADRCFLLDADNEVRPSALRKLSDALDADPAAAFAYSIIEVFGDERSLLSYLPWSTSSLVRGAYIDAMSMLRTDALRSLGGFAESTDPVLYGWEDYDLWLRLASQGGHGTWVPEPLCRYRRHRSSMLSVTNLDHSGPRMAIRERYPDLPWPA